LFGSITLDEYAGPTSLASTTMLGEDANSLRYGEEPIQEPVASSWSMAKRTFSLSN
jgi:hypothetical protein